MTDLSQLDNDPEYKPIVTAPPGASAELGKVYADIIIQRIKTLSLHMVDWDEPTRDAYVKAERAILTAQLKGWRRDQPWAAWVKMMVTGEETTYGELLVNERFADIESLAARLI